MLRANAVKLYIKKYKDFLFSLLFINFSFCEYFHKLNVIFRVLTDLSTSEVTD